MKISEIYEKYKIMPNLQDHMLRVAAVASLICDNFNEPLPKEDIITACLLHDMGNIIKFRLDYFPEFNKPEGLDYWHKVQDEYFKKYGHDEHEATLQIIREIGLSQRLIDLANSNQFSLLCGHRDSKDMVIKILHYADGRVVPHGVLSYDERMEDAKKRYENHKNFFQEEGRQKLIDCGRELEKQIFEKCRIKPEDITDESIKYLVQELKEFMI